jgi:glutathione S-transferase
LKDDREAAVKLYTTDRAPNPRRVRWVMAEKGVEDIEIVPVDLFAGEHKTPAYRGMAGLPHVPALELDDGTVLTESLAISRYLDALYPEPNLFGRDTKEVAIVEMWTRRTEIYLAQPLMMAVRHGHPALAALEPPNPAVGAYNMATAERFMRAMDRHLTGREFIAADRLTIADIIAVVSIDFTKLLKYQPPSDLVHVDRWLQAMRQRPAAAVR